jgi:hypothetical protein
VGRRASCGSERRRGISLYEMGHGRGAPSSGPRTSRSRSAVEAPHRAGLVRVGAEARSRRPVERASYEADWIHGRGGLPFIAISVVLVFFISDGCGYPCTVGTDTTIKMILLLLKGGLSKGLYCCSSYSL